MPLHSHDTSERNRYLRLAPISFFTCITELAAGIFAGSLALITDAIHTLLDVFENLLNAFVSDRARFLHNPEHIRRIGFAVTLVLIGLSSGFMGYEAVQKLLGRDREVLVAWTVVIAAFSLLMNLWQLRIHFDAPEEHRNLTHWGQTLHIMTDVAGSLAAIIGTAMAAFLGIAQADAWAAITIVIIIWGRMLYGAHQAFGPQRKAPGHHCHHKH